MSKAERGVENAAHFAIFGLMLKPAKNMRTLVIVCVIAMTLTYACGGGGARPGGLTVTPTIATETATAAATVGSAATATRVEPAIQAPSATALERPVPPSMPQGGAPAGAAVAVGSGAYFLLGVNYPWLSYGNDIGSNAFGSYGFHTGGAYASDFQAMPGAGVHVVRLFAFADGRSIQFDGSGTPTGVSADTFADLDAAVALARQNNVYLDIVLLDFSFLYQASSSGAVQLGGHSDVFTDPVKRGALVSNVMAPVITRYANERHILSWELMNEPEWVISDLPLPAVNKRAQPMTMSDFWTYGAAVATTAHAVGARVTVGSASLRWNKVWTPAFAAGRGLPQLGLDYYQTHYYEWMDGNRTDDPELGRTTWSPLTQSAGALGLDKPIVVGEAKDSPEVRDAVWNNGYAGFWLWSYHPDKTSDHFVTDPSSSSWEAAHAAAVRIPSQ